jgi:hypothetical protein
MTAAHYAPKSIEFYARELRFLFEYYPDVLPGDIIDSHITRVHVLCKGCAAVWQGQMPWGSHRLLALFIA